MHYSSFKLGFMASILAFGSFSSVFGAEEEIPLEIGGKRQRNITTEKADTTESKRQRTDGISAAPQNALKENEDEAVALPTIVSQPSGQGTSLSLPTGIQARIEHAEGEENLSNFAPAKIQSTDVLIRITAPNEAIMPALCAIEKKEYIKAANILKSINSKAASILKSTKNSEENTLQQYVKRSLLFQDYLSSLYYLKKLEVKGKIISKEGSDKTTYRVLHNLSLRRNRIHPDDIMLTSYYQAAMRLEGRTEAITDLDAFTIFNNVRNYQNLSFKIRMKADLSKAQLRFFERIEPTLMSDRDAYTILQECIKNAFLSRKWRVKANFFMAAIDYPKQTPSRINDDIFFKIFEDTSKNEKLRPDIRAYADIYKARINLDQRTNHLAYEEAISLLSSIQANSTIAIGLRAKAAHLAFFHLDKMSQQPVNE